MLVKVIRTRDGELVPFDVTRIERAMEKAAESMGLKDLGFVDEIAENVVEKLNEYIENNTENSIVTIEQIQDAVEKELMDKKYFDVAKAFIIYRDERKKKRAKQKEKLEKKIEKNSLKIVKTDGKKEPFDVEKVKNTYKRVSFGLARVCPFEEISDSLKKYIVDDMKTSDILKMMIKSAVDLISVENTSWQFIAGRLALIDMYKQASYNRNMDINKIYDPQEYLNLFENYIEKGLYY
ncbi:MAG: ATP cone domain-containing protein, partial [Patescibacteria group bacterium]